jgi:hypothetical protein
VFGVDSSTMAASKVEVHFAATSNRYYTLQRCNHLETGDWTNVLGQTDIPGSDGPVSLEDTNSSTQQFYRVTYVSGVLPGLVAYWALDGNANDRSPNANNGSANGTTPTTNRFGDANRAFYFSGSGAYVGVPDSLSLDVTNMTLAFWFRMDTSDTARELVNKFGGNGNIAFGSEYLASDGKIRFRISTDGSNGTVSDCASTTTIAMGTWYHFAGTYDGATMKTYINGILENTWTASGSIYNSSEDVKIGRYGYYSGWVFHGAMDEVAIWNRALASNEVVKSMHPIVLR